MSSFSEKATLRVTRTSLMSRAAPSSSAWILVFECGGEVWARPLPAGRRISVGRDSSADIAVPDETLSRRHADFSRTGDAVWVTDLGSTNGTFIAGEQVQNRRVNPGDVVVLGKSARVRFIWSERDEEPVTDQPVIGPTTQRLFAQAREIAAAEIGVLITGETGTGKDVIAAYVHDRSRRAGKPMLTLNCGALAEDLVESAFFGHVRGAFTGADEARPGAFEEADGGTLFLDEIGELSPRAQSALLRVLETGKFRPIGGGHEKTADVRVVAATHRDLQEMSQSGEFRSDLYYRIAPTVLELPPLRQRAQEIPVLARHLLAQACQRHGRSVELSQEAIEELQSRPWPGNIRELKNVIERAVVLNNSDVLAASDLSESDGGSGVRPLDEVLREREMQLIVGALRACQGNVSAAADKVSMPRRTLSRRIKEMDLGDRVYDRSYSAPDASHYPIDLREMLAAFETEIVSEAVQFYGSRNRAASALEISRKRLDRRMEPAP